MYQKIFGHLTVTECWDGEGLPPIGERVYTNTLSPEGTYESAIITGYLPQRGELVAVYVLEDCEDWNWSSYGLDDGGTHSFIPCRQAELRSA